MLKLPCLMHLEKDKIDPTTIFQLYSSIGNGFFLLHNNIHITTLGFLLHLASDRWYVLGTYEYWLCYDDFYFLCNLDETILFHFWNRMKILKKKLSLLSYLDQQWPPFVHFPLIIFTLDINMSHGGLSFILLEPQLK